jgi:hypothetical protein
MREPMSNEASEPTSEPLPPLIPPYEPPPAEYEERDGRPSDLETKRSD